MSFIPSVLPNDRSDYLKQAKGCTPCVLGPVELPSEPVRSLPPQSTIEYIPYERTVVEYQQVERVQRVPRQVVTTQYDVIKKRAKRPVQRTVTDYYTVQHIVDYELQYVTEKKVEYVPRQVISQRVDYIPFEREIVHYPTEAIDAKYSTYMPAKSEIQYVPYSNITYPYSSKQTRYVPSQSVVGEQTKRKGSVYKVYNPRPGQTDRLQFLGNLRDTIILQNNNSGKSLTSAPGEVGLSPTSGVDQQRFNLVKVGDAAVLQAYNTNLALQFAAIKEGEKLTVERLDMNPLQLIDIEETGDPDRYRLVPAKNRELCVVAQGERVRLSARKAQKQREQSWIMYNLSKII